MKLYLSGPIATEPDFVNLFKKDADWLRDVGYEVVNPVEVQACESRSCGGEDKSEYIHTWQCYMKYDLAAMLTCDAVAVQADHWASKGAALEIYLAMQVGMPVNSVRQWASKAVREYVASIKNQPLQVLSPVLESRVLKDIPQA